MKTTSRLLPLAALLVATAVLFSGGCKGKDTIAVSRIGKPGQVANPTPADGATDATSTQILSWDQPAGAETYIVYFGTTNPPAYQVEQAEATFDPGTLELGNKYYWRVDAVNGDGTSPGAVWSFTTGALPPQASNPTPADGATDLPTNQQLSWDAVPGVTEYIVYFGTSPDTLIDTQTGTSYDPGTLTATTLYYWRVDTVNQIGTTQGKTWTLYTVGMPGAAINPDPADGATDVSTATALRWLSVGGASHEVFFSDNALDLTNIGTATGEIANPGELNANTTYYWRVDSTNATGTTPGTQWSFTTGNGSLLLEWARNPGGDGGDGRRFPVIGDILPDGSFYVAGEFDDNNPITFGEGEPNETIMDYSLFGGASDAMYVAKYDKDGKLVWVTGAYDT
ncbi:MAG: fibronectin type III domain-containing protein [Planctomycetota bacterium]